MSSYESYSIFCTFKGSYLENKSESICLIELAETRVCPQNFVPHEGIAKTQYICCLQSGSSDTTRGRDFFLVNLITNFDA